MNIDAQDAIDPIIYVRLVYIIFSVFLFSADVLKVSLPRIPGKQLGIKLVSKKLVLRK